MEHMRWEPQPVGWVLRVSYTDPCIGRRFAGLVYPMTRGWIWEVFGIDKAGLVDSPEQAKKMVENETRDSQEGG
jgi:hypothetical protein